MRVVSVVVGKACRRLGHLQGVGVDADVSRGSRDVQSSTGLQAATLQVDVVGHQVQVTFDEQAKILGAAHPVNKRIHCTINKACANSFNAISFFGNSGTMPSLST